MALGVEVLVERVLAGARRVVGDDRQCALLGDSLANLVAIVGGVGHDHFGRHVFDQGEGLRRVTALAGGEMEADRTAQASDGHMDFRAQAAA